MIESYYHLQLRCDNPNCTGGFDNDVATQAFYEPTEKLAVMQANISKWKYYKSTNKAICSECQQKMEFGEQRRLLKGTEQ